MRHLIFLTCFLILGKMSAQKHDYLWMIGYGQVGGDLYPKYNTTRINFKEQPTQPENIKIKMQFAGFSPIAIMADKEGELLFYTNGCYIANAVGDTVEGSVPLNYAGDPHFEEDCAAPLDDGYQIAWSTVALPLAPDEGKYAVLHKDKKSNFPNHQNPLFAWNQYVTFLDMFANGGAGKVTQQRVVVSDTIAYSDVTACRHANGKDWWFMTMREDTNLFYKFLLKKDTVLGPFTQEIGDAWDTTKDVCQAVFSPNGTQYARVNWCNGVMLYDFDRSTGMLSNYRNYGKGCAANSDSVKLCGVGFSPNSRYLYVSGWLKMYQFDTQVPDLASSQQLIGVYDGYRDTVGAATLVPQQFFVMMNGPDCKIYIGSPNQGQVFHIIHQPNLPAPFCDFEQHALKLATLRAFNMPNFAHYRLGSAMPVCDSTLSVVSAIWGLPQHKTTPHLFPNPTSGQVSLDIDLLQHRSGLFQVFNMSGRAVHTELLNNRQLSYQLDLSSLPVGMYFYGVRTNIGVIGQGKLAIVR